MGLAKFNDYLKVIIVMLGFIPAFSADTCAQEISFLPAGTVGLFFDYEHTSADSGYDGSSKAVSLREMYTDRYNLDDGDFSGNVSFQTSRYNFKLQYGLFETVNIGITAPYISKKRESDLSSSSSSADSGFVDYLQDAESSGIGDYELWGIWRVAYTDSHDFRFGLTYVGDNAPYYYKDPDNVAIGSGAQEVLLSIYWLFYPITTDMIIDTEVTSIVVLDSTIEDADGKSYKTKKGQGLRFQFSVSKNFDAFNVGGGLEAVTQGGTVIDGVQQSDGYLNYSADLFLNYGNLHRLEETSLTMPWMFQFSIKNDLFGTNTTSDLTFGLKLFLYL